jgi:hypothetical protein
VLKELQQNIDTVHAIRPIATGVLDTSGADSIWSKMLAADPKVGCLNCLPQEYVDMTVPDAVTTMCQELITNWSSRDNCRGVILVKPIRFPRTVDQNSLLQVHAAHTLLQRL